MEQKLRRPRMSRIRHIKPEFFKHESLFELEETTKLPCRLALSGMWCISDVEGRFEWAPRRIKLEVLPYDLLDFALVLDALATGGFVHKYEVDSKTYGHIPTFHKHQRVDRSKEPESMLPDHSVHCALCSTRGTEGEPLVALTGTKGASVKVSERVSVSESNSHSRLGSADEAKQSQSRREHNPESLAKNAVALSEHMWEIGKATGAVGPPLRADDPCLPMLTELIAERLATHETATPDTPQIEGGLTARDASTIWALNSFQTAVWFLTQVDPYLHIGCPDPPEGEVGFTVEDIRAVMKAFGWPNMPEQDSVGNAPLNLLKALVHWAFNTSDYWPKKLTTLDATLRAMPKIREQFKKYISFLKPEQVAKIMGEDVSEPSNDPDCHEDCMFSPDGKDIMHHPDCYHSGRHGYRIELSKEELGI
jgi:hypothetical protein